MILKEPWSGEFAYRLNCTLGLDILDACVSVCVWDGEREAKNEANTGKISKPYR